MSPKETKSPERTQQTNSKWSKPKSKSKFKSKFESKAASPNRNRQSSPTHRHSSSSRTVPKIPSGKVLNASAHYTSHIQNGLHSNNHSHSHIHKRAHNHTRNPSFNKNDSSLSPDDISEANNANERAAISRARQVARRWLQNWEGLWLWLEDGDATAEAGRDDVMM